MRIVAGIEAEECQALRLQLNKCTVLTFIVSKPLNCTIGCPLRVSLVLRITGRPEVIVKYTVVPTSLG